MKTIDEYVAEVGEQLPRWYPERQRILEDLKLHLADRVAAGEGETDVVRHMEPPAAYAAALTEALELVPAPIARRVGAFAIDLAIGLPVAIIPLLIFIKASAVSGGPLEFLRIIWEGDMGPFAIIWILAWVPFASLPVLSVAYFPVVEAIFGTTAGKHLLGIGVVVQDGTRVDWAKAYLRRIPFFFQFYPIDSVFALFSKRRQRAFDRVAQTLVVSYPKSTAA